MRICGEGVCEILSFPSKAFCQKETAELVIAEYFNY